MMKQLLCGDNGYGGHNILGVTSMVTGNFISTIQTINTEKPLLRKKRAKEIYSAGNFGWQYGRSHFDEKGQHFLEIE